MVEHELPKLAAGVRFPSPAPVFALLFVILFAGCAAPHEAIVEKPQAQSPSGRLRTPFGQASHPAVPVIPRLRLEGGDFSWPLKGRVVSYFGSQSEYSINKGIDIASKEGEDIYAVKDGLVRYMSNSLKGYGKVIILDHGGGLISLYAHASEVLVSEGEKVVRNAVIAKAGSTGRSRVSGIHFEVRKDNEPQNPLYYLP